MEINWHEAWAVGRRGFHLNNVHPDLEKYGDKVFANSKRILVPLCGKSLDLNWFDSNGFETVGVELVYEPVKTLKNLHNLEEVEPVGSYRLFKGERISIFQGDFFEATDDSLDTFDGVWDRASLVAVDPSMRSSYVKVLMGLVFQPARMLLETFTFDQTKHSGPPYSIETSEVRQLFSSCKVKILKEIKATNGRSVRSKLDEWQTTLYEIHLDTRN